MSNAGQGGEGVIWRKNHDNAITIAIKFLIDKVFSARLVPYRDVYKYYFGERGGAWNGTFEETREFWKAICQRQNNVESLLKPLLRSCCSRHAVETFRVTFGGVV